MVFEFTTYIQPKDPNNLVEPLDSPSVIILNWIVIVYTIIYAFVVGTFLIIRRNKRPLKQRSPFILGITLIAFCVDSLLVCLRIVLLRGNGYFPCFLLMYIASYAFMGTCLPIILSAWRLFLIFVIHDKLREKIKNSGTEHVEKLCRRLSFLVSEKFLIGVVSVFIVLHTVMYVLILVLDEAARSASGCVAPRYIIYINLPQGIYFVVILIAGIVTLRVNDNFNISKELVLSAIVLILGILLYGIITVLTQFLGMDFEYKYVNAIFPFVISILLTSHIIHLAPIIMSFNWNQLRKGDIKGWWEGSVLFTADFDALQIHEILDDPVLSKLLDEYCKKEWSSENYLFLKEVGCIKSIKDKKAKIEQIENIIRKYILMTGIMTLNLNTADIEPLQKKLETIKSQPLDKVEVNELDNFFDSTVKTVKIVMSDTVMRFTKTTQYKNEIERRKEKHAVLKQVGIE